MVRRASEVLRAVFISPELAIALAVALGVRFAATDAETLAARLTSLDTSSALTLLGLPLSLVVGSYALGQGVLHPEQGRQELVAWPNYWRLKTRVWIAISYSIGGVVVFWFGLYLIWKGWTRLGTPLSAAGLTGACVALGTVAIAAFRVREILDRNLSDGGRGI